MSPKTDAESRVSRVLCNALYELGSPDFYQQSAADRVVALLAEAGFEISESGAGARVEAAQLDAERWKERAEQAATTRNEIDARWKAETDRAMTAENESRALGVRLAEAERREADVKEDRDSWRGRAVEAEQRLADVIAVVDAAPDPTGERHFEYPMGWSDCADAVRAAAAPVEPGTRPWESNEIALTVDGEATTHTHYQPVEPGTRQEDATK